MDQNDYFLSRDYIWKCCLQNSDHFVQASVYWLVMAEAIRNPVCCMKYGLNSKYFSLSTLLWVHECYNYINSLAPMGCGSNFESILFKLMQNGSLGTHCEITLRWMPQKLTYEKSTLVQVMARWSPEPRHYLRQCWPRSRLPYTITKPRRVNVLSPSNTWLCEFVILIRFGSVTGFFLLGIKNKTKN